MTRKDEEQCCMTLFRRFSSNTYLWLSYAFLVTLELNIDSCDIQLWDMDADKLFIPEYEFIWQLQWSSYGRIF